MAASSEPTVREEVIKETINMVLKEKALVDTLSAYSMEHDKDTRKRLCTSVERTLLKEQKLAEKREEIGVIFHGFWTNRLEIQEKSYRLKKCFSRGKQCSVKFPDKISGLERDCRPFFISLHLSDGTSTFFCTITFIRTFYLAEPNMPFKSGATNLRWIINVFMISASKGYLDYFERMMVYLKRKGYTLHREADTDFQHDLKVKIKQAHQFQLMKPEETS